MRIYKHAKDLKDWIWLHTCNSFNIGNIEVPSGGQGSEERSHVCSALEAFCRLLVTLAVINLQVHNGPLSRNQQKNKFLYTFP